MQQKQIGVLVKFPKPRQDLRIDLPTVGLATLKQCKLAGLKGIVLKDKQNIFLEKNKCINFANKMSISTASLTGSSITNSLRKKSKYSLCGIISVGGKAVTLFL